MNAIQNLLIDSLNGFSLDQLPFFIFLVLVAGGLAHVVQLVLNRKTGESTLKYAALMAVTVAVLASLVKNTEPLAILGAAVLLLLLRSKEKSTLETLGKFVILAIGLGCGTGSIIQTVFGALLILIVIFFTPVKKEDA